MWQTFYAANVLKSPDTRRGTPNPVIKKEIMNNLILSPLFHITVHKHFTDTNGRYIECCAGCFKAIFVHDFQRMDYTPQRKGNHCTYDTGLNFSAN
jgi:hypothetical protein